MYIPDDSEKRSRPESVFWTTPFPVKWTTPKNGVVQISKMDDSATKWTTPVQNGRLRPIIPHHHALQRDMPVNIESPLRRSKSSCATRRTAS